MPPSSSSQQHAIFPSWNSGGWISQQSEEEVMTQVGVIAQLAVKPTADKTQVSHVSPTVPQHRQQDIHTPLTSLCSHVQSGAM